MDGRGGEVIRPTLKVARGYLTDPLASQETAKSGMGGEETATYTSWQSPSSCTWEAYTGR
jgi:hypothetical protein